MPEPKEIGHQIKFPNTLLGLFKRGWWEIPEIMASTGIGLLGIGLGLIAAINYARNDGDNREYKKVYIIMRPDDPRVPRLKNPVYTQYKG